MRLSPFSGASFSHQIADARRDSLFQFIREKSGLMARASHLNPSCDWPARVNAKAT
jgi:hypothetical protein